MCLSCTQARELISQIHIIIQLKSNSVMKANSRGEKNNQETEFTKSLYGMLNGFKIIATSDRLASLMWNLPIFGLGSLFQQAWS